MNNVHVIRKCVIKGMLSKDELLERMQLENLLLVGELPVIGTS